MEPTRSSNKQRRRLGFTFHRTFVLLRAGITQVLDVASRSAGSSSRCLERDTIRKLTQLGTIYVESIPRYGYGAGLLDAKNCLSDFGTYAQTYDRLLELVDTLWLMHYHLSAPHGPGPTFWHELVTARFRSGNEFSTEDIVDQIGDFIYRTEGRQLAERSLRSTATVFLGTYTKDEALGRLQILHQIDSNRYRVLEPEPPSVWAFGYALIDYWLAQFGKERLSANLDQLSAPGGPGSLFLCGAGRVNLMLRKLLEIGYVDVYRIAPPYQVVLLRHDLKPLLQRLYGTAEPF